ncbi:hypothetical protein KDW_44620 [Dictyobacter vulcani]|uniref:Enterochelin esterase N-terminal domain-containing protein n=1 Tax=Dictyobacter vulcani TaxID=2607529 RepID=A0A5J4KUW8_9CHLR|nr:enterochelin esterase domain-containing protein [Dictyobacter vulcani]GER90300.1 hypothetical protein KDW_44620 [Dictyobacter vulcani]
MLAAQTIESPRIASLYTSLKIGDTTALETFWQEVTEHGSPLIEAIEGSSTHALLTFLWRNQMETKNVVIWGGPAGMDRPEHNQMLRLLETDLWYRTYRVQMDLRGVYTYSVNDPLDGSNTTDGFGTRFIPDPLNLKPVCWA